MKLTHEMKISLELTDQERDALRERVAALRRRTFKLWEDLSKLETDICLHTFEHREDEDAEYNVCTTCYKVEGLVKR